MPRLPEIDSIVETTVYLYSESRRITKQVARGYGLTGPQVTALKLLDSIGQLSLSDLSARMSAKNSTITGLVDRMVRDGLVERRRSDRDRRVVLIELTERGRQLAPKIPVTAMDIFARALKALSREEQRQLMDIVTKLAANVRRQVEEVGEQPDPQ